MKNIFHRVKSFIVDNSRVFVTHLLLLGVLYLVNRGFLNSLISSMSDAGLAGILLIGWVYFLKFAFMPYVWVSSAILLLLILVTLRTKWLLTVRFSIFLATMLGVHAIAVLAIFYGPKPYLAESRLTEAYAGGKPVPVSEKCPSEITEISQKEGTPLPLTDDLEWVQQFGFSGQQGNHHLNFVVDNQGHTYLSGEVTIHENLALCRLWKSTAYLVRYTPDGAIDRFWDKSGFKIFRSELSSDEDNIADITVDSSDNLYVIFHSEGLVYPTRCQLMRYLPDGKLDKSWASEGIFGFEHDLSQIGEEQFCPRDAKTDDEGNIYLLGVASTLFEVPDEAKEEAYKDKRVVRVGSRSALAKFLPNGSPDSSWGNKGFLTVPDSTGNWQHSYDASFIITDDDFVIAETNGDEFVRVTPEGELDMSWGISGVATFDGLTDFHETADGNLFVSYVDKEAVYWRNGDKTIHIQPYSPTMNTVSWDAEHLRLESSNIAEGFRLSITPNAIYVSGNSVAELEEAGRSPFPGVVAVEKFDMSGDLDKSWGDQGLKMFGSFHSDEVSFVYSDKEENLYISGTTGGNLGGNSCNSPGLSCAADYAYVAKLE